MTAIATFALDAARNPELSKEFNNIFAEGPEALTKWFNKKGYSVSAQEIKDLIRDTSKKIEPYIFPY